jgi:23S rRNA U2552 (ribose-2'-O)-methylase RlmE/FtsJ
MEGDGFLHRYFLNNSDKRLHKWIHYFDIYERHFARFRGKKPVMIEIGVQGGGSLAMWKAYFGEGSKIVGIDITPACKQHEGEDIEIFIGSQDSPDLIAEILGKYPKIDIVLDDGSHVAPDTIGSFNLLYERLSPDGVYMVEDTHTSYWPKYRGGFRNSDTFIEFSKNKIDDINAFHTLGALPPTRFTVSTDSITHYDSIVVFERRSQGVRQAYKTSGAHPPA